MDENFLTRMTQVADPSYMRPSAPTPRPAQQAEAPKRERMSTIDVIGGLLDAVAVSGGSQAGYRPTLDAKLQREREAELYPLELRKAQLANQKTQQEMMYDQNEVLGQAASYVQRAYQNGGVQGALNVFDRLGPRIMTPEQYQGERQQFEANPEGYIQALSVFTGGKDPAYEYIDVQDEAGKLVTIGVNKADPNDRIVVGGAPGEKPPASVLEYQMSKEDPAYMDFLERKARAGRAPAQPRAPTLADQRVAYLISQGMEPSRAQAIGLGLETPPGKVNNSKGAKQSVAIDRARTRIDTMLNSPEWKSGYGLGAGVGKVANFVGGLVGANPAPQTAAKEAQIAALKQIVQDALESRGLTNKDWERVEPLFPNMAMSYTQQRERLAEIASILAEIQQQPPVDAPQDDGEPAPAGPSVSNW